MTLIFFNAPQRPAHIPFGRCRGRAYATEFRAARAALAIGARWFRCQRCGHWHVARRPILTRKAAA